jgi:hypothetical protein
VLKIRDNKRPLKKRYIVWLSTRLVDDDANSLLHFILVGLSAMRNYIVPPC